MQSLLRLNMTTLGVCLLNDSDASAKGPIPLGSNNNLSNFDGRAGFFLLIFLSHLNGRKHGDSGSSLSMKQGISETYSNGVLEGAGAKTS